MHLILDKNVHSWRSWKLLDGFAIPDPTVAFKVKVRAVSVIAFSTGKPFVQKKKNRNQMLSGDAV